MISVRDWHLFVNEYSSVNSKDEIVDLLLH